MRQSNPLGRLEPGNADFEDYDPAILSVGSGASDSLVTSWGSGRIDRDMTYHQLKELLDSSLHYDPGLRAILDKRLSGRLGATLRHQRDPKLVNE